MSRIRNDHLTVRYSRGDKPANVQHPLAAGTSALHTFCDDGMHGYTPKEKSKITAGAVTALVIVAWLFVIALAMLSAA